jgi:hypothetical protein
VLNSGGAVPGDNYQDSLYENPGGWENNWISVKLVGVKTNRAGHRREDHGHAAVGRRRVEAALPRGHERRLVRLEQLRPAHRPRQGEDDRVDRDHVADEQDAQVFRNVPVNSRIEIKEFEKGFTRRDVSEFTLAGPSSDP